MVAATSRRTTQDERRNRMYIMRDPPFRVLKHIVTPFCSSLTSIFCYFSPRVILHSSPPVQNGLVGKSELTAADNITLPPSRLLARVDGRATSVVWASFDDGGVHIQSGNLLLGAASS